LDARPHLSFLLLSVVRNWNYKSRCDGATLIRTAVMNTNCESIKLPLYIITVTAPTQILAVYNLGHANQHYEEFL
jgi:hypothetical protein